MKRLIILFFLLSCLSSLVSASIPDMTTPEIVQELTLNEQLILNSAENNWKLYKEQKTELMNVLIELDKSKQDLATSQTSLIEAETKRQQSELRAIGILDSWQNCQDELVKAQKNDIYYFVGGLILGGLIVYGIR